MECNPFSYEPWRGNRTFEYMFDILEADIVVFQETKIQRKDLRDDMVLVPGWDCYFSLPKAKKGYSGVAIYTRNATCCPIRAEEGLTGLLCPPNSSVSFRELPEDQQIGGYPTLEQLSELETDPVILDSEGRCVILEFPAFVLLGIYSPANRDESRDSFRHNFIDLMDTRIRNLVAMGKRVFVTGDINIARGEIDAAHATEAIRKGTATEDEFVSTPARRVFNQLLSDGKVLGARDEGREEPALFDICRSFHPERRGMYTCWEQRINARPGNYGSRIDYVLCSLNTQDWFCDSNIQEGLMGSDHCPVYAVFKDTVRLEEREVNMLDIVNPPGMFKNGERQQEYTTKYLLPTSGRLIPEFDKRRSIKDMFSRKPSTTMPTSTPRVPTLEHSMSTQETQVSTAGLGSPIKTAAGSSQQIKGVVRKRSQKSEVIAPVSVKRSKSGTAQQSTPPTAGQTSLRGFFKPKNDAVGRTGRSISGNPESVSNGIITEQSVAFPIKSTEVATSTSSEAMQAVPTDTATQGDQPDLSNPIAPASSQDGGFVIDPIVSKEDWSKLFTKRPVPRCEGHQEPCISLTTKKPGINCGRAFWICPRPLGPSGNKEKGTQWRCPTFIWASDWNPSAS
ncbi:DNA-(apurinic or apyrimidinic site) lyase APN2 [Aspergillus clavatus NRRL 1]|uniref:DNA-(apurinic or apyrimidinic site) endonuclease 2 n=1 Tax=Aspergillus clavatus (strain ATCC 1007 / CBS 513.65 / DSM 816 / NCTC 3887 / NRRL 1 / QM 1276 / 107) TaxID=344612 RepID=A1CJ86_ASPCL|nr:ap endonuclease [Aspergillus clavatus NRRL 1]EAW09210.1 ap endonuclease [Aspergillus clavatus NRRL 1]